MPGYNSSKEGRFEVGDKEDVVSTIEMTGATGGYEMDGMMASRSAGSTG
jgi:hypothetical protein